MINGVDVNNGLCVNPPSSLCIEARRKLSFLSLWPPSCIVCGSFETKTCSKERYPFLDAMLWLNYCIAKFLSDISFVLPFLWVSFGLSLFCGR